jgi:hypothetical protein
MRISRSTTARARVVSALSSELRQPLARVVTLTLVCVTAVTPGPSSALNAQHVKLDPQVGLYLPSRTSLQHSELHIQQKVGMTVGVRLTLVFTRRFDVVTGITYLPGYAMFRGAGKRIDLSTASHLLTGSTGARYWLLPAVRRFSWEVHTGFGVVFGGEPAYEDLFESSVVNGILGSTVRCQVGRIVSLQLGVQERLYRVRFGGGPAGNTKPPLRVSIGLALPFLEWAPLARSKAAF